MNRKRPSTGGTGGAGRESDAAVRAADRNGDGEATRRTDSEAEIAWPEPPPPPEPPPAPRFVEQEQDGAAGREGVVPARSIRRSDVYAQPVVDGRELRDGVWARLGRRGRSLLTTKAERREAELEARLRSAPRVTRTNTIALLSPKGGVGKTTMTFVLGSVLASHAKLRTIAIDANRDFGTLASLAPDALRSERSLADLLEELETVNSAAELRSYLSCLPSGLHLLASPDRAEVMAQMTSQSYGELLAFTAQYYDVILLDLGTGIVDPLAQFAVKRADQLVLVTSPEYVTAEKVLGALRYLSGEAAVKARPGSAHEEGLTVVLNKAASATSAQGRAIEEQFRRAGIARHLRVPYDDQLRIMLDSATYTLGGLSRATRTQVKELGLVAGGKLV